MQGMSVGEEKRGTGEQGSSGFRLPVVNWAMAAEADGEDETAEVGPVASGPGLEPGLEPGPVAVGSAPVVPTAEATPTPPG
ncbi:hypothetical protein, partial [Kitasatospora sp. NPDC093558]|uniref:hypothetical protein n=1 Tax=Kitasatospora sp. NPDC093558 TaxID=3155201 RepID=UPI00342DF848